MSVDSLHADYKRYLLDWQLLEDIHLGEKAIKAAGMKYLPKLGGQDIEEYNAYKERGCFFNAFARTVQGLAGFIFRKPTKSYLPEQIKRLMPRIMSNGQSFEDMCPEIASNVLKYGRVGLLVDAQLDSDPYIALYKAPSIINWQTQFINGQEQLTLLVLQEEYDVQKSSIFDVEQEIQYRVLLLTEEGVEVTIWRKENKENSDKWVIFQTLYPEILGKRQEKILFFFIGSETNTSKINKPPLIDMGYINISHWRLSVDYNHGLHFCSLPTPWASGFDPKQELTIGPVHVWRSEDIGARCGYLEFTGQGLISVKSAMRAAEEQMAILGARIIEQTRSRVETAEASKIRQSGESGALTTIVNNISSGLTHAMKGLAYWMGEKDLDEIYVQLNTDFIDTSLKPEEVTSLIKAYQANVISLDTLLYNFDKGELLPPGHSVDDEIAALEAQKLESSKNIMDEDDEKAEEEPEEEKNPIEEE